MRKLHFAFNESSNYLTLLDLISLRRYYLLFQLLADSAGPEGTYETGFHFPNIFTTQEVEDSIQIAFSQLSTNIKIVSPITQRYPEIHDTDVKNIIISI